MKKIVLLLVATLVLSACDEPPAMDVKGIKTNLPAYQKERVVIEGVVSRWTSKDPQLFAIADVTEAQKETQFIIPVRYEGPRPGTGEKVRVVGRLDMQKREFVASEVKR